MTSPLRAPRSLLLILYVLGSPISMNTPSSSLERKVRSRLHRTSRWREARSKFLKANPRCVSCGRVAVIIDHIDGHGPGWESRFWDATRWQSMCTPCHSVKTITHDNVANGRGIQGGRGGYRGLAPAREAQQPAFRAPGTTGEAFHGQPAPADPRTAAAVALVAALTRRKTNA